MKILRAIPSWVTSTTFALALYYGVEWLFRQGKLTIYWQQVCQMAGIMAITSLGLNVIYGFNGQFSLGHIGFYAIGAYTSALITKDWQTQWSGTRTGALVGVLALELALVAAGVVFMLLRVGRLQKRLRESLSRWLSQFEVGFLSFLVLAVALIISVVVGVGVMRGFFAALPGFFESLLGRLPASVATQAVFFLALICGALLASIIALIIGLPLLKLASDYFGIATLGFAMMIYSALQNADKVIPTMKGARGMVGIPRLTTWTWAFVLTTIVIIITRNLRYSSVGRAIVSVREDEIAAKAMGIDVARYKTLAFTIGALFAGLAGGLYAHLYTFLHPSTFNFIKGFDPLIIIVFGGLGSITGTIVASAGWAFLLEGLRVLLPQGFEAWRFVIYPVLLLLIMLLRPQGLFGGVEFGWLRPPKIARREIVAPAARPAEVVANPDKHSPESGGVVQ